MLGYGRSVVWLAGLVMVSMASLDDRSGAAEPHAAFAVKDGWVECVLRRDGKPVPDAVIQIIDERGKNFATGDTDQQGQAVFPLAPGSSFIVEIKTKERSADPIRLFKIDGAIEPSRVLLSYGLRPCCRSKLPGGTLDRGNVSILEGVNPRSKGVAMEESDAQTAGTEADRGGRPGIWTPLVVIGLVAVGLAGFYIYRHSAAAVVVPPVKRDLAQEAREDLERRNFRPLSASLEGLLADPNYEPIPTQASALLLQQAPDFTLLDANGKEWSLARQLK
jgi:hypothetical protein